MIRKIRNITLQILAGANVAVVAGMLLVGYSDRINPMEHSFWANVGLAFPVFLAVNICFLVFFLFVRKNMRSCRSQACFCAISLYAITALSTFRATFRPVH